jgi:hypothetical protein
MGRACRMNLEKSDTFSITLRKPEGKRPLGRPRRRCLNNIKNDLGDRMGWYGLDCSGSGQGPLEGSCGHGNEPS